MRWDFYLCCFIAALPFYLAAMPLPWGKDAGIAIAHNTRCESISSGAEDGLALVARSLIGFHRGVISEADGPRSHFWPSSSIYTLEAICKYGFFTGVAFGCDRLMRENPDPWIYPITLNPAGEIIKSDPVP